MQITCLAVLVISSLLAAAEPSPQSWQEWALWAEKLHPITDAGGHGPDVGSDEWANALAKRLGVMDADGHGPDIGSSEWRAAIEKKLLRKPLAVEAYVWQRRDSPDLREALSRSRPLVSSYHFLAAEIGRGPSGLQVNRSTLPDHLLRGHGLVLRIGASLAGESWRHGEALESLLDEIAWLVAKPASEFQIDYDCPQRSLDDYLFLLERIRQRHPTKRWSITALPSWLDEPATGRLFAAADGVVLQVHSLRLPERPGQPVLLCDPAAAMAAVDKMAGLGRSFRVALNTYACEVLFDEEGRVVEVVSEDVHQVPPVNASRRAVGISDAEALAGLVSAWTGNPPRGLEGIVWYRLPLESDQRNWRWITWSRVAAGIPPRSLLEITASQSDGGAWDLVLRNAGERDELLPEFITAGCRALVIEGLNGYVAEDDSRLRLEVASWPWLPPGASFKAGWLRNAEPERSPLPTISPPP